ncbi:MAG: thiolase family protein, partial [Planctomycetota bacterium]
MSLETTFIPYGTYWSTPFCRWQGSLSGHNSIELAAATARRFLEAREIATESFDGVVLGHTVPQRYCFYGAPWLAGMLGAPGLTGTVVSQACATSVRALATAAMEIETGLRESVLAITCDRTSNGPHIYHPDPRGIGGRGAAEDPVWDNFNLDPHAGCSMLQTAENVAKEIGISKQQ